MLAYELIGTPITSSKVGYSEFVGFQIKYDVAEVGVSANEATG